jgi:3-phenylpropionate/cinnamic acid dioxygenase small subunit
MTTATRLSTARAAEFLYAEARLLDSHDYDAWLALFDEDGYYWVPADGATDPDHQVAIVSEPVKRLRSRIVQLQTGYRHSQLPQSNTQHYITNVHVEDELDENGLIPVYSSYLVIEARFGHVQHWPGRAMHHLRLTADDELRIVRKTVVLINNDMPVPSMAFLL